MIKSIIKMGLAQIGIQIQRTNRIASGRPNPIHQWDDDAAFQKIMMLVEGHTLVDTLRCYMLYQFAKQTINLSGDIAEVGVYRGGTAMLLAKTLEGIKKEIYLFDTFKGMPPTDPQKDFHRLGDFNDTSLVAVKSYLSGCLNVRYNPGYFPDTASGFRDKVFSMVHVDVDIYQSVKDCMEFFYTRLSAGGIMIFDDYGFLTCPGAKRAVDEFFGDKTEKPIYLPTGQCVVIKLGSANG